MVIFPIVALIIGILIGMSHVVPLFILKQAPSTILLLLLFIVGIDIGSNKNVMKEIKRFGLKVIFLPLFIVLGSLAGGLFSGYLLNMKYCDALAIASGFGWYSLSGILVSNLANVELGTLAFLANLARELFSFFIIPLISKRGKLICIAPGGATSMDSTLPFIVRYGGSEIAIVAIVSGIVLSALVPIMVPFFLSLK